MKECDSNDRGIEDSPGRIDDRLALFRLCVWCRAGQVQEILDCEGDIYCDSYNLIYITIKMTMN